MTFAEIVLILGVVASYFKIQKKYKLVYWNWHVFFALFCILDSSIFVFMTFAEIVLILGVVASYFKIQKKYKK